MQVLFFKRTGGTSCEKLTRTVSLIEEPDGYHTFQVQSVFKDERGILPPVTLIYDEIICPEGSPNDEPTITEVVGRVDTMKMTGRKFMVEPAWKRKLMNWIGNHILWIVMAGGAVGCVAVIYITDPGLFQLALQEIMKMFNLGSGTNTPPVVDPPIVDPPVVDPPHQLPPGFDPNDPSTWGG